MTNPTPPGQVPEALRLAEELEAAADFPAYPRAPYRAAAATLRTLHAQVAALTAPVAQAGPDFYTACAWHEGGGEGGWIALPGYSSETEHGVKSLVLEAARKEGYTGTAAGRLLELGWEIRPVYLAPAQPAPGVESNTAGAVLPEPALMARDTYTGEEVLGYDADAMRDFGNQQFNAGREFERERAAAVRAVASNGQAPAVAASEVPGKEAWRVACPFCGGEHTGRTFHKGSQVIECQNCLARGPQADDADAAKLAWATRAPTPTAQAAPAAGAVAGPSVLLRKQELEALLRGPRQDAMLLAFDPVYWEELGGPGPDLVGLYLAPTTAAQADSGTLKDHQIAALVNELRDIAVKFHATQQLRERIAHVVVPALRAGADSGVQEDAAPTSREVALIEAIYSECDHAARNGMRLPPALDKHRSNVVAVPEINIEAAVIGWINSHALKWANVRDSQPLDAARATGASNGS